MSGATASLPDLHGVSNASLNVQAGLSAFLDIAQSLASGSDDSPLHGLHQAIGGLDTVLEIDVSGLSERLPQALTTIENALPADTLHYIAEIKEAYQSVSDFLSNSDLVRQIPQGSSLEQTALALVDQVLAHFRTRLESLGSSLFDAATLEQVKEALATIEQLASGSAVPADELSDFLSHNLLGIAPDFLKEAQAHLTSALAVLDPYAEASLEASLAIPRDTLAVAFDGVAAAIRALDPADPSAYAVVESRLQVFADALSAVFDVLETLYAALTTAVSAPAWEVLLDDYAEVLAAIPLADIPTVDDAVDAVAATVESLLSRLSMVLAPEDLAAQVTRISTTIHEQFAQSGLAQVRQILIAFIEKIRSALDGIPVGEVQQAVEGMLERVREEIEKLEIDQVRTTIEAGFQKAQDFVEQNIGNDLLSGVNDTLSSALTQFQNIPVAELGTALATAVQNAGQVVQDLETSLTSALDEVKKLLEALDGIDFRPVSDEVIDEINALKAKLAQIRPESLSDIERTAIQAGLSIIRAIDLEGMIENELKKGFHTLDDEIAEAIERVLDAWLEFRRRIGGLDGSGLAAPVTALFDEIGTAVQGVNGSLAIAPVRKLLDELVGKLETLSPEAILDPLQAPYDRMMTTIEQAGPEAWIEPLRTLHAEIDRLIDLIDITPLLTTLEQKEKELFAQAQQALADALDAVDLPEPLNAFYQQMKALVLGLTDAIFANPDEALREFSLTLSTSIRPSTLFQPLDLAFDRLMAVVESMPADQVLAALEAIRKGIGTALPVMNPANIVAAMREAQGRVAALSPAVLPGVVSLPGLRASLAARLELSADDGSAKAQLLARFELVLAPIDLSLPDSRLRRLSAAHETLLAALRRRINAMNATGAQAAFQRLDSNLRRILPAFLTQATPLDMRAVRAGLATLRPSTKARRIDHAVELFLAKLAPLQNVVDVAVNGFFAEIRAAVLVLHPSALKEPLDAVYTTLREKLHVLDPDALASSLRDGIWDSLIDPLKAIDPANLKSQLHALFEALLGKVTGSIDGILDQAKQAIDAFLAQIRKALAQILDTLKLQIEQILAGVTELLEKLDKLVVDDLFNRLLNLLDNLKTSFDKELDRVGNEFNTMLDSIPVAA